MLVTYYPCKGAVRPLITAGFAVNFFIKEVNKSTQTNTQGEQIIHNFESESVKRSPGLQSLLGAGIAYRINKRLSSRILALYAQDLFKTTDTPITEKLYTIGLQAGLFYRF